MVAPISRSRSIRVYASYVTYRLVAFFVLLAVPPALTAQDTTLDEAGNGALRVFFDCQSYGRGRDSGPCDFDFYRQEIPFVNYTRDREDSQVHVLLTQETTGSAGRRFTLDFIGREEFVDIDDRLEVVTPANLARERLLTEIAAAMKLGLIRYIARTDQAANIRIISEDFERDVGVATAETDPWNFWTFRVRGNGNLRVNERTQSYEISGGFTANRITDDLKLEFGIGGDYDENIFETSDTTSVTSVRESYNFDGLTVWSLSDHWSIGMAYAAEHSSFDNEDLRLDLSSAIEFNIFPYSESTRRQFNILYTAGLSHTNYVEETVFLKMKETLPLHKIGAGLSVRQPWGTSYGFLEFSQYLHNLSKNRATVNLGANIRLFRGLSLTTNVRYSRIRDQLNVPAGDATEEEVLLEQRILQSGYEYRLSFGFSYTFGSIFTNVVNPRLERF